MAKPIGEDSRIKVKERTVLQKFDGDPETGKLIETVEMEDGQIVKVTKEE